MFSKVSGLVTSPPPSLAVTSQLIKKAGPLRKIPVSRGKAEEPTDEDFADAAVWNISLPSDPGASYNLTLEVAYVADVARIYLDGELLTDDQWTGRNFSVSLTRYASSGVFSSPLQLKLLPLQRSEPIYLPDPPSFPPGANSLVELVGVSLSWVQLLEMSVE